MTTEATDGLRARIESANATCDRQHNAYARMGWMHTIEALESCLPIAEERDRLRAEVESVHALSNHPKATAAATVRDLLREAEEMLDAAHVDLVDARSERYALAARVKRLEQAINAAVDAMDYARRQWAGTGLSAVGDLEDALTECRAAMSASVVDGDSEGA